MEMTTGFITFFITFFVAVCIAMGVKIFKEFDRSEKLQIIKVFLYCVLFAVIATGIVVTI
jgi:hypothetical protein